jgi:type I restriction enzyme R subunit
LFIDRQPLNPQNLIQAFSRTNRLFDDKKQYGQVVTFQAHDQYTRQIDYALRLYSRGGEGNPISEDFDDVKKSFGISLKAVRNLARTPEGIAGLSRKQKGAFIHLFRSLDHDFAHLKAFSVYESSMLDEYGFSEEEYEDLAAMYKNVLEELKKDKDQDDPADEPIHDDYELVAYSRIKVDFEYIVGLLRDFVESLDAPDDEIDEEEFREKIKTLRETIDEFAGDNAKLAALLRQIVDEIEQDKKRFMGQDISVIINQMRYAAVDKAVRSFAEKWFLGFDDVKYEALHLRDGELANESKLKDSADYAAYKAATPDAMAKFKFRKAMIDDFKENLMAEVAPLLG